MVEKEKEKRKERGEEGMRKRESKENGKKKREGVKLNLG